jgi:hypothetical protein
MEQLDHTYSLEVIERLYRVKQLHKSLSGYYRAKSTDNKRILELWREIEREESLLRADGLDVS